MGVLLLAARCNAAEKVHRGQTSLKCLSSSIANVLALCILRSCYSVLAAGFAVLQGSSWQNTTITIGGVWIPVPGRDLLEVSEWLLLNTPADLCDLTVNGQSTCEGTSIVEATHIIGDIIGHDRRQRGRSADVERLKKEIQKRLNARAAKPS